jgi:glycosyltransferase involved in cell wall biosynthesis
VRIGIDAHAAERDGSGNCTYIRELIRGLLEVDRENEYILYTIDGGHRFYGEVRGRERVRLRALRVPNPVLRIPVLLAAASARDALDVLHVQYIAPPRHRGRLVVTVHDTSFFHLPATFSRTEALRSRLLVPRSARAAARVITGSESAKRDVVADCGVDPGRVEVIPLGVAGAFARARASAPGSDVPAKYGIDCPFVLSVGRLNARKNLSALIAAFSLAKKRHGLPHVLVISGRENHGSGGVLEAAREAGPGAVRFTGFVADEDLPALYARAALFAYPSLFEGFGLPVVEAMAAGVPVLVSDTPALRETVGEAGWAVDPFQVEGMAAAIIRVLRDDRLRKDLIAKGLTRAEEFSWPRTARRTLDVYRLAAGTRP